LCSQNSAQAMGSTKQMVATIQSLELTEALQYAAEANATARGTTDCKRGIAAFLNKEQIVW
jgi:methylglutaconyl-CoA hydratase